METEADVTPCFISRVSTLVMLLQIPRLPYTCLFDLKKKILKKDDLCEGSENEFIYDKSVESKLWQRTPEEAAGGRDAPGASLNVTFPVQLD